MKWNVFLFCVAATFIDAIALNGPLFSAGTNRSYTVVDTGQINCYDDVGNVISAPPPGTDFFGQDAQHTGHGPNYTPSADGLTVQDNRTGLTWQQTPDRNRDGKIDAVDKLSFNEAMAYGATLNTQAYGGYSDWRLPSIKELYSLMNFQGTDPSGYEGTDLSGLLPFMDTNYFAFGYGDTGAGERLIDAQYATCTLYTGTIMQGVRGMFGVNFADGRIKGYPTDLLPGQSVYKKFYVLYVRDTTNYGINAFTANGDGTVTDTATGLMWQQDDSGTGLTWKEALAYAENLTLAGHGDWRLPNAKELQSVVDYTRAPESTGSAAINPVFSCTVILNEAGNADAPYYWTSTTHASWSAQPGRCGAYVCFGRALGCMQGEWMDVHGAGAQRSDPKYDDGTDYSTGHGPQGDAVRIHNYVRCVRDYSETPDTHSIGQPVAADFDGDGRADPATFNAAGAWVIRPSKQNYAATKFNWGSAAWQPLAGDVDGDGLADLILYDSQTGWYAALSTDHYRTAGPVAFCLPGHSPVVADFDGDQLADLSLYGDDGWHIKLSGNGYQGCRQSYPPAAARTMPVAADFDGDGRADPALYDSGTGLWTVRLSGSEYQSRTAGPFTVGDDLPMAADFDGDGQADPAVFLPQTGEWYLWPSGSNYTRCGPNQAP